MSYPKLVEWAMSKRVPDFEWFRTVIPAWDNTPRRMERASMFLGATPEVFGEWVERALHQTYLFNPPGRRFLFINAWNEWCEGAYLEPDLHQGSARLQALQAALARTSTLAAETATNWCPPGAIPGLADVARDYLRAAAILGREALHG